MVKYKCNNPETVSRNHHSSGVKATLVYFLISGFFGPNENLSTTLIANKDLR